jgi:diguanylate cyclase (GGDEF)-like protein
MNSGKTPFLDDANEEVSTLIETLLATEQRLDKLTGGEVDSVAYRDGRMFVLRRAQEQLRDNEDARQTAILNALPAHIALLDTQGVIVSVNETWRHFACADVLQGPGHALGVNYLALCDGAREAGSSEAHQIADGARSVLAGAANSFSIEYPCHSPTEQRWFLMTVTPLAGERPNGAVVMHLDITEQKRAEIRIERLNRVYAVLSGINTLIVRVRSRDELFGETCSIAAQTGGFGLAWIGTIDPETLEIARMAGAGPDADLGDLTFDTPEWRELLRRMVASKRLAYTNDLRDDSLPQSPTRVTMLARGYRSSILLPLLVGGTVHGILGLSSKEPKFFDESELRLLKELAGDISFALDHLQKVEKLDYLAYYDELTGLANRNLFLERLAQTMRSATGGGHGLAVFFLDLERFRNINDSLGRAAGDALLKQVSEVLSRGAGDPNLLARVGPDQFAIVLPELRAEGDVARLVNSRIQAFAEHPFRLEDAVFRIAVRVGAALYPQDGADAETLFRNAEAALKEAKLRGDRYLFYAPNMSAATTGKLTLENQLRQALDNGEFVLHYQPQVNLVSGKVISAEALIRWNDPRTGLVPPGRFIPILEETGLIYDVGRWALRKAIADYLRWRAAGLAAVRVSVNVSPLQLRNRGFVDEIRQAIDARAATGLELEITEGVIMEDVKHSIATLQAIRGTGVRIAVDDFGTGFSSLGYLAKLPLDTLKIDRSFVVDMTVGPQGLALVSTIINLAHALKLTVVAEGVETEEQSRLLRLLDCDEMQGFLFSKAVPVEIFETQFLAPAAIAAVTA